MKIELENIQAIEHVSIEAPEEGGVIVFRGGQGTGKSTALRALQKVAGGDPGKLEVRDGEDIGYAHIGDCTLTVRRSGVRKKGDIVVDSIEGRLNLSNLVNPGIADPERADAARLKALVSLTGVKATPKDFDEIIPENTKLNVEWDTDDPLVLAGRVKRSLEEHSRRHEKESKKAIDKSKALRERAKEVDLTLEDDEAKLEAVHKEAVESLIRAQGTLEAHQEHEAKKKAAQGQIKELEASYSGLSIQEAKNDGTLARARLDKAKATLEAAEAEFDQANNEYEMATMAYKNAVSHHEATLQMKEILNVTINSPSEAEIQRLRDSVDRCSKDIAIGHKVAVAKEELALSDSESKRSKDLGKQAEKFRSAAKATDEVISKLLPQCPLRFKDNRLVISTDRSEDELFSDLSDGERYKVGINLCADQLHEHGLMVINQDAWEGLTDSSRQEIVDHLKARGVVAATAEAIDGDLEVIAI